MPTVLMFLPDRLQFENRWNTAGAKHGDPTADRYDLNTGPSSLACHLTYSKRALTDRANSYSALLPGWFATESYIPGDLGAGSSSG